MADAVICVISISPAKGKPLMVLFVKSMSRPSEISSGFDPAPGFEHDLRGAALGAAIGVRDHAGHRQPMPVLHGGVAHIGELGLSPRGLAVKPAVGIGRTGMGIVLALLPVEVGAAISVAAAILGAKALL